MLACLLCGFCRSVFVQTTPDMGSHQRFFSGFQVNKPNPVGQLMQRQLLLTSLKRLVYIDPVTMELKGALELSTGQYSIAAVRQYVTVILPGFWLISYFLLFFIFIDLRKLYVSWENVYLSSYYACRLHAWKCGCSAGCFPFRAPNDMSSNNMWVTLFRPSLRMSHLCVTLMSLIPLNDLVSLHTGDRAKVCRQGSR